MPSYLIEMLGDGDRDLMEHAVKYAADRKFTAEVTLGPDETKGTFVVRNHRHALGEPETVELVPWSEEAEAGIETQARRVPVDDVWELRIY